MDGPRSSPAPLAEADQAFLERAVELGRRGWGKVHPNPMVGCVLVRDGVVVAEGWHRVYGGPHAETVALEIAGPAARGATAYVSLEPCRHEGKTPACTRALVASGVARVVFGAMDPGPESAGGADELIAAGVSVSGPHFDGVRARTLNPAFFHRHERDTPWVALKLAVSLDGAIAAREGVQTALTGPEADREVHRLRSGFDGLMVGGATARVDDPRLTVREGFEPRVPPVRIVLDPSARLSSQSALFDEIDRAPVWVFTRDDASEAELERLESAGATVHPVPAHGAHVLDLACVLTTCREAGLSAVLCEGGGQLAGALLRDDFVSRIYLFVAPRFLGPQAVPAFCDAPVHGAGSAWVPATAARTLGADTLITLDRASTPGGA